MSREKHSVAPLVKEFYPEYYSLHEYPADQCVVFTKVDLPWGILGNFGRTSIIVNGVSFRTAEQLFQMMKFKEAEQLMDLYKSGGLFLKHKAKKWENRDKRRADWGSMVIDAIKMCIQLKYEQNEDFRNELERTKGMYIVEGQKKGPDTWGAKLTDDVYAGSNLMGRLLMELRDNGKLEYHLPDNALDFIEIVKLELDK